MSELIEINEGAKFYIDPYDVHVIDEIYRENVYLVDPKPGMRVLDIGAHRGIFSVFCASRGALVESYEPHPETYADLVRNIQLNGVAGSVVCHNTGVWDAEGRQILHECRGNFGGNSMHGTAPGPEVPVISFEQALGDRMWDIVKIDAEGSEYEILLGASNLAWYKIRYMTIEMHNWRDDQKLYNRLMHLLRDNFSQVGGVMEACGRYNYIYCRR